MACHDLHIDVRTCSLKQPATCSHAHVVRPLQHLPNLRDIPSLRPLITTISSHVGPLTFHAELDRIMHALKHDHANVRYDALTRLKHVLKQYRGEMESGNMDGAVRSDVMLEYT